MSGYHRVEADRAGPSAVGILVPPAKRTFVILRPRSVPVDLLVCRSPEDPRFADLAHDEASAAAQGLWRALNSWDGSAGLAVADGRLSLQVGGFLLVACARTPGQPYTPLPATPDDAERLRAALCPGAGREVYFNMRFFERA
ncbi:MAG: hypothetical protein ACRC33_08950 [Gemmataceae bacterium]